MNHFIGTQQLLSQESFLKYIGQLYEAFIDLEDFARINAVNHGETFTINAQRWQRLIKDKEPRRFFSGGSGFFLAYVKLEVEQLIYKDWTNAKLVLPTKGKERNARLSELVGEAREIKETLIQRPFLEPVSCCIIQVLEAIISEYADTPKRPTVNGVEVDFEPMRWNGTLNSLTTLFYDLSKKEVKGAGGTIEMVLAADVDKIKAFLSMCFSFKGSPISLATLDTYFQESKPDKKSRGKRTINADPYFEHEE